MPSICAIILNWNNYIDTLRCITSLQESTLQVDKIILVDNGSKDGSSQRLIEKCNELVLINNGHNLGYAAGINVGIRRAINDEYQYLLLINNDAFLEKECLQELFDAGDADGSVGVIGPRIYYPNKNIVWQGGGFFNYRSGGNVVPEKNRKPHAYVERIVDASFLTGCILLVKADVFKSIGLFDEDLFFYEEDVDFCLRAVRAGYKLKYVPDAISWHNVEGIKINEFALYNRAKSRIMVLRKNFGLTQYWYYVFIHFVLFTPYKIVQSINSPHPSRTIRSWFLGSWDGLIKPINHKS